MTSSRSVATSNKTIRVLHNALRFASSEALKHYFPTIRRWDDLAEFRGHANW